MSPEAEAYLAKARRSLGNAQAILTIEIGEEAGRAAYLAALHAAQALIFERTGRIARTHRGVHAQFIKLAARDARFGADLRRFLSEGYRLKSTADYEAGPESMVPLQEAAAAVETAARFVEAAAAALNDEQPRLANHK